MHEVIAVTVTVHLTVPCLYSPSTQSGEYPKGEGVFAQVPLAVILRQPPPPGFRLRRSFGGRSRRTPPTKRPREIITVSVHLIMRTGISRPPPPPFGHLLPDEESGWRAFTGGAVFGYTSALSASLHRWHHKLCTRSNAGGPAGGYGF